jgi:hypothetical protein
MAYLHTSFKESSFSMQKVYLHLKNKDLASLVYPFFPPTNLIRQSSKLHYSTDGIYIYESVHGASSVQHHKDHKKISSEDGA